MRIAEYDQILADLVAIPSVNDHEAAVADYLEKLLAKHHITAQRVPYAPGRDNLVAEIGNGQGPVLGFDGHADTVALGDRAKWQTDPLVGTIKAGKMYGRGVTDMKAGLAAGMIAMIQLQDAGVLLNGTIRLLATVGEEIGELGAHQLAEQGYVDDMAGIVIGEPSGVVKDFVTQPAAQSIFPLSPEERDALVAANQNTEQHFVVAAHKGTLAFRVDSVGQAAHSSMPELGYNAITPLLTFYNRVQQYFEDQAGLKDPILGPATPVVTLLNAGEQINTVPASASMSINVRTIPEKTNDAMLADIQALADEVNQAEQAHLTIRVISKLSPMSTDPNARLVQLTKRIGEKHLKQQLPVIGVSGGTDASPIVDRNPNIEAVVFGPGNFSAHQVNEYVDMGIYHQYINLYIDLFKHYLAGM
ncbi:ArgE/DapE family deacylase [Schleiferilactobacillus harbinensis]|uniref:ArgE/DapE family deacylase n=1 Tax=Schleiferilactobacillus harbinensis TaxID=304207 RepID=A0ABU7SWR8_9LACO